MTEYFVEHLASLRRAQIGIRRTQHCSLKVNVKHLGTVDLENFIHIIASECQFFIYRLDSSNKWGTFLAEIQPSSEALLRHQSHELEHYIYSVCFIKFNKLNLLRILKIIIHVQEVTQRFLIKGPTINIRVTGLLDKILKSEVLCHCTECWYDTEPSLLTMVVYDLIVQNLKPSISNGDVSIHQ